MGAYKIGVASQRTGVSPATLRLWEEQYGLLHPARSPGGTRVYTDDDLARAGLIRELVQTQGYSLRGISIVLDNPVPELQETLDYLSELENSGSDRLAAGARQARLVLESTHLRETTNRDRIREGRLLSQVQAVLSRLAEAEDFESAASALLTGARDLTGAQRTLIGIYDAPSDRLHLVLRLASQHVNPTGYGPWRVDSLLPLGWRHSIWNRESFLVSEVQPYELPSEALGEVTGAGIRSFYTAPLIAGSNLVGILMIASRHAHGITAEARDICDRLAAPTGPVIAYHHDRARVAAPAAADRP